MLAPPHTILRDGNRMLPIRHTGNGSIDQGFRLVHSDLTARRITRW